MTPDDFFRSMRTLADPGPEPDPADDGPPDPEPDEDDGA